MFLCRPFRIDQQFFIVFSFFFLLSSFAFAEVRVSLGYEDYRQSHDWFEYQGIMDFNHLQLGKMLSPKLTFNTSMYSNFDPEDEDNYEPIPLPEEEQVLEIGAEYQTHFTVVKSDEQTGSEWASEFVPAKHYHVQYITGNHITIPDHTSMVPMVAGTKGNNYFGCFWGDVQDSNRIDIISGGRVAYSLMGSEIRRYFIARDGSISSLSTFVIFYCEDCQIQKVIFYTGDGDLFKTDRHTIGWYTEKRGRDLDDLLAAIPWF